MIKRGKSRNLCLLTMMAFSITIIAGCSNQEATPATSTQTEAPTQAEPQEETIAEGNAQTQSTAGTDVLLVIEDVFTESPYLSWTITDEFNDMTASFGNALINWDEEAGTGTILTDGDQINRADIKELIFYSGFGTYAIQEITSPEGVETEAFSGADQKLTIPEAEEETVLTLTVRYELTRETKELSVAILP
ncbi:MAG: hypothetical protein ACRDBO_21640 [Lachnospiraceae bacterium]